MKTIKDVHNYIDEQEYILDPIDIVYREDMAIYSEDMMDLLNHIVIHNKSIIDAIKKQNEELQQKIKCENKSNKTEKFKLSNEKAIIKREYKDVEDKVDLLFYSYYENDLNKLIENIPTAEISFVKLCILKKVNKIKKNIKELSINYEFEKAAKLKEEIDIYNGILERLNIEEHLIESEEIEDSYDPRIILLPHGNTTYCYEDLLLCLKETKEIKNGFYKVLSGYFTDTKDTKTIRKYDKLFEYENPNGLRILYAILPNNYIAICKIFMKDKNKSTKIESIYEEAYQRFISNRENIINNLNNPDFFIAQSILVGEIVTLLDSIEKESKLGD